MAQVGGGGGVEGVGGGCVVCFKQGMDLSISFVFQFQNGNRK